MLWQRFSPWPGNFRMLWVWQKQTKQETQNGQRGGGVRVQTVPELFLWVEKKYKNLHFKMHFNI